MMITKKMVKEATMGLLKNGFKGEIKIFTGKRSFGKVSNLTELRVRLYELASTKNYKVYSIDFGEGMVEVLNFREEKTENEVVKVEEKIETVAKKVEKKPNYVLYVGQKKVDIVAEDSFDAIVTALEELETVKGHNYAMNISKNMDLEFCEKQLDCGAVTIATDIWVKNLNAKGYKKVQVEERLTETQIANRRKLLSGSTKKIEKNVVEEVKNAKPNKSTLIVNSFMEEIDLSNVVKMKDLGFDLECEVSTHILAFELSNNVKIREKSKRVILDRIAAKIKNIILINDCAA